MICLILSICQAVGNFFSRKENMNYELPQVFHEYTQGINLVDGYDCDISLTNVSCNGHYECNVRTWIFGLHRASMPSDLTHNAPHALKSIQRTLGRLSVPVFIDQKDNNVDLWAGSLNRVLSNGSFPSQYLHGAVNTSEDFSPQSYLQNETKWFSQGIETKMRWVTRSTNGSRTHQKLATLGNQTVCPQRPCTRHLGNSLPETSGWASRSWFAHGGQGRTPPGRPSNFNKASIRDADYAHVDPRKLSAPPHHVSIVIMKSFQN